MKPKSNKFKELEGKTVKYIVHKMAGNDETLAITFTDGSRLNVRSWDSEEYSSGLNTRMTIK